MYSLSVMVEKHSYYSFTYLWIYQIYTLYIHKNVHFYILLSSTESPGRPLKNVILSIMKDFMTK